MRLSFVMVGNENLSDLDSNKSCYVLADEESFADNNEDDHGALLITSEKSLRERVRVRERREREGE